MNRRWTAYLVTALLGAACASQEPAQPPSLDNYDSVQPATTAGVPAPAGEAASDSRAAHGRYLVQILGCGSCHTDGALVGEPRRDRLLAGSSIGIAHSDPTQGSNPAIVFPPNLTPDVATGIGALSEAALVALLRDGSNRHGGPKLMVMPWPAYQVLSDGDAQAIAAYLRSLPPVSHTVPERVRQGQASNDEYVYFGVYRSRR